MHIRNNSVLHYLKYFYLYDMAVGLVIYSKSRAFTAKDMAKNSRPKPKNSKAKAKKFGLKAKAKD